MPKTPAHVLNHCHRSLAMVRERHNAILDRIVRAVLLSMGTKFKELPLPGTTGNYRPDLTIISPDNSTATILEVSCPIEGSPLLLEEAAMAKVDK